MSFGQANNGDAFGAQSASTTCVYFAFHSYCSAVPTPAPSSSSACGFWGAPCSTLASSTTAQSSAAPTPVIPEGTGLKTTMTTTNLFGTRTLEGRLFAVVTTNAQGSTITMQQVAGATDTWLVPLSSTPSQTPSQNPSSSSPTRTPSASTFSSSSQLTLAPSEASTLSEVTPTTTVENSPAASPAAANGTLSSPAPASQQNTHHGISGGAIAAAVVVPIVVLSLLGLLLLFLLRRRRRNRNQTMHTPARPSDASWGTSVEKAGFVATAVPYGSQHKDAYGTENTTGASTLASSPTHGSASALEETLGGGDSLPTTNYATTTSPPVLGTAALANTTQQRQANDVYDISAHHVHTPYENISGTQEPSAVFSGFSGAGAATSRDQSGGNAGLFSSAWVSQEPSRNYTGRRSMDEDPRDDATSVLSGGDDETEVEYHDAQVSSAAVGVTQRASVINMIDAKHGRGSSGSSTRSGESAERPRA